MKRLLILLSLIAWNAHASNGWNRYQLIVDRAPFGSEPTAPEMPVVQPNGAFAKQYRLCMLYQNSQGEIRAGLVSKTNNKNWILTEGESEGGLLLLDVRLDEGIAVIQKGSETAELALAGIGDSLSQMEKPRRAETASVQKRTTSKRFRTTRTQEVSEQFRAALVDSAPKRPSIRRVEKKILSAGGGAGSANQTAHRERRATQPQQVATIRPVRISNGYRIQSIPSHIEEQLLAKGL